MLFALSEKGEGTMYQKKSIGFSKNALRSALSVKQNNPSRFTSCLTQFTLYALLFTGFLLLYALPSSTFAAEKLNVIGSGNADTVKIVGSDKSGTYGDMHLYKEDYWNVNFFDTYSSVNALHAPAFTVRKARGSIVSPLAVANGDQIGNFAFRGYDGSSWLQRGLISVFIDGVVSGGSIPMQIRFYTGSNTISQRMVITSAGKVGIGNTDPQYLLHLQGGAYSDGYGWYTGSSRELKENIKELPKEDAIVAFNKLNPVTFNYKTNNEEKHVGFIVEDVPDIVASKDRKGLSPMDIVALLTKVIQEQQKTISELSEKVSKLEQRLK